MAETDVLRMVAEVSDRASAPLMQIKKNLKDLAGTDLSVHGRDLARVRKEVDTLVASTTGFRRSGTDLHNFSKHFEHLRDKAKESGELIKRTFEPVLATLGITTLSVGGAMTAAAFAVNNFVKSGRSLGELSDKSGFSPKFLQGWKGASEVFRVEADKIDSMAQDLGTKLLLLGRTKEGGPLNTNALIQVPDFAATVGKMRAEMQKAEVPLEERESNSIRILLDRVHELHEAGESAIALRTKLGKLGIDPDFFNFSEHGGAGFLKEVEDFQKRMGAIDPHAADAWAKSMAKLEASLEGIRNAVGNELIGDFTKFNKQVAAFVEENKGEIKQDLVELIRGLAAAFRDVAAAFQIASPALHWLANVTVNPLHTALDAYEHPEETKKKLDEDARKNREETEKTNPALAERQLNPDGTIAETAGQAKANAYMNYLKEILFGKQHPAPDVPPIELPQIEVNPAHGGRFEELNARPEAPAVKLPDHSENITRGIYIAAIDANRELNKNTSQITELNRLLEEWLHPVNGSTPTSGPIKVASLAGGLGYSPAGTEGGTTPAGGSTPTAPSGLTPMGKLPGFGTGSDGLSVTRPSALGSTSDEPTNVSSRPGGTIASPPGRTEANEAASAISGAQGTPAAAVDDAMANLEGKEEHRDGALIQRYLTSGEAGMNPADAAWCAATVNSALKRQNIPGSGSQLATSFLRWGKPVEGAIEKGDVLVQAHGHKFGERNGHVGFATGEERINPRTGQPEVEMFSGNKGDMGRRSWEPRSSVTPRRATDEMIARAKAAAPTTRVEAPNSSRAGDTPAHFANVRSNNPGAMYMGPSAEKFGALGKDIIDHGKHEIANFPTPVHGLAANMDNLSQHYEGMRIGDAIKKWSDNGRGEVPGYDRNQVITKEMLANKDFMVPFFKSLTKGEAPGNYPMSEAQRQQAFEWYQQGHPGEHALARDESPEMSAGVLNVKKMTGDLPQNATASGSMLMDSARAPTPGLYEPGAFLAKAAEAQRMEHSVSVNGTGQLDVSVTAPRGTRTRASGDGLFSRVRVNRQIAGEHSPANTQTVSDGSPNNEE